MRTSAALASFRVVQIFDCCLVYCSNKNEKTKCMTDKRQTCAKYIYWHTVLFNENTLCSCSYEVLSPLLLTKFLYLWALLLLWSTHCIINSTCTRFNDDAIVHMRWYAIYLLLLLQFWQCVWSTVCHHWIVVSGQIINAFA